MVVFGDAIIIFSDKSCKYPNTDNPLLNWTRWYRAAITDSAAQIRMAESSIRRLPKAVWLDREATSPLPIELPDISTARVFRICVVLGPPFAISPAVQGSSMPHMIGRVDEQDGWIHVFNGLQLRALLQELSTTADFVLYLERKEAALLRGRLHYAASELDLVAYFTANNRRIPSASCGLCLPEKLWEDLRANPLYQNRIKQDGVSYFWDSKIERLIKDYMDSELEKGNDLEMIYFEKVARLMAREHRFCRRALVMWISQRVSTVRPGIDELGSCFPSKTGDLVYVLLIGPGSTREDYEEYRKTRYMSLELRCYAAKHQFPSTRYILGLAMDVSGGRGGSEDYLLLDTEDKDWGSEDVERAKKAREAIESISTTQRVRFVVDEYSK